MFNTEDRYFAAGLVGAVTALYAASVFAFFSSEGVQIAQQVPAQDNSQVAVVSKAIPADTSQLRTIMDQTQTRGNFSPLGSVSPVIPGIHCAVSDVNLDLTYSFRNIPDGCSQIFTEE